MPDLNEFKKVEPTETVQAASPVKATNPVQPSSTELNTQSTTASATPQAKADSTPKPAPKPKQKAPKTKVKPKTAAILFEKTTYNFGEITEGDIIKHKFKFKNTGNAELVIKSASASCGCTDPSYPFLGIPPGEEGFIGVSYNSVSKDGPQKPEVTIKTNASDHAFVLYLEGDVVAKPKKEKTTENIDSSGLTKN